MKLYHSVIPLAISGSVLIYKYNKWLKNVFTDNNKFYRSLVFILNKSIYNAVIDYENNNGNIKLTFPETRLIILKKFQNIHNLHP